METNICLEVTCDNCDETIVVQGANEHYINRELLSLGWNVDNDLCPECSQLKVEDI